MAKNQTLKERLYIIIFEADTFAGKLFDVVLLVAILLSVLAVMLESVVDIKVHHGELLYTIEWVFTILFSLEYIARLYVSEKPLRYVKSFYGIIDLLSILPTFIGLVVSGAHSLLIIRSIRLLRVFRVLKMVRYLGEASSLMTALKASRAKIIVFIGAVFSLTVILGTIMYLIEGGENGFTSIPRSIYWAVVTLTTVGYGDIAPGTTLGQIVATAIMILGYGIIAVPTGIVSAEITSQSKKLQEQEKSCARCGAIGHNDAARYCYQCGESMLNSKK
ncbi:ion transporter [Fulvivirga lutimaris]|uniref:ion transporter n=1 Tax=Fulvivirga lutimaris TaxID=1819566 RepID=UPI0012BD35E8|nr:ion transporter [Fulvivirga lutimaris]MTI38690.1 ion transporter [Fulvivirga lutimaris]